MRFKSQIWEYFIKYTDEEHLINHKKESGSEYPRAFCDSMEDEKFFRILNTFRWLTKYSLSHIRMSEPMLKPSNSDILEATEIMKTDGENLIINAKRYPKGELRNGLAKIARKRLLCASYYTRLVAEDYFKNKACGEVGLTVKGRTFYFHRLVFLTTDDVVAAKLTEEYIRKLKTEFSDLEIEYRLRSGSERQQAILTITPLEVARKYKAELAKARRIYLDEVNNV